jgi:RNase adaptor protein for sRNA GlmZ degradation
MIVSMLHTVCTGCTGGKEQNATHIVDCMHETFKLLQQLNSTTRRHRQNGAHFAGLRTQQPI